MSSFDPTRRLVMVAALIVMGHALEPGDPITIVDEPEKPGEVDKVVAEMLWLKGSAVYAEDARPTPVESREDEALRVVTLERSEGAWWTVNAPWFDKPEKVQGEMPARERYNAVVAEGRPLELATPLASDGPSGGNATNTDTVEVPSGRASRATGSTTPGADQNADKPAEGEKTKDTE